MSRGKLITIVVLFVAVVGAWLTTPSFHGGDGTCAYATDNTFFETVSATSTSYTVNVGGYTSYVLVTNDGATNEAYVNFEGIPATTADFKLLAGESLAVTVRTNRMGIVCDTDETTTVRVFGIVKGND